MLVDELAEQGMSELLLHLIETEPSADPVQDQLRKIAQLRLRARDAALTEAQRQGAMDEAIAAQRELIDEHADHEQRPIWQTDLAEMLLVDVLSGRHRRAAAFVLYGVPTPEQAAAVAKLAPDALQLLESADLRFFQLEGLLPREPEHVQQRVQTGLWDRMMEEYWRKRTRYLLGEAALLTATLPDGAAYYQSLGATPQQASSPAAERQRLLGVAAEKLRPVAGSAEAGPLQREATAMLGRSLTLAGRPGDALDVLRPVTAETPAASPADLHARLAEALARAAANQPADALAALDRLADHPQTRADLLSRLLVTDAKHRVLRDQPGQTGDSPHAAAYQPYLDLLNDPALAEQRAGLRQYIYDRWASAIPPGTPTAKLPPAVQLAVGEISRVRGQALAAEAVRAGKADIPAAAKPLLEQAVTVNQTLLDAEPAPGPAIAAQARYNLALARYWLKPGDPVNAMEAGRLLVDAARDAPLQPVSEQAIAVGVGLLRQAATATPAPAGAAEAYRDAAGVLFGAFGTTAAADNERLYFALTVHAPAGEDAEVVRVLGAIPEDHPTWFDAQPHRLAALARLAGDAPADQKDAAINQLTTTARQVQTAADRAQHVQGQAATRLALVRADVLRGRLDEALKALDALQKDVAGDPLLLTEVLETRIRALVEADRLEAATAAARQMMRTDPDAGAATIDAVVTGLGVRLEQLRDRVDREPAVTAQAGLRDEAQRLAGSAAVLAELLVDWAEVRGLAGDELAAYQLLHARTLRRAGDPAGAAALLQPLARAYPDDVEILRELAEALFAQGDPASLDQAAELYDRQIASHSPPYPPQWWAAWVRRLEIMQARGADPDAIRTRIRQLRFTDPTLGGEPHKSRLEAMLGE